jgi:hypothetical protein
MVDMESVAIPAGKGLYGLHIETFDRSGNGLYAECIQNTDFEQGDSLPGWRTLSAGSYLWLNNAYPANPANPQALTVAAYCSSAAPRAGVVAEGYEGISIRKGEKYHLTFFLRAPTSVVPVALHVALEDSLSSRHLSDEYVVNPSYEWQICRHTFTTTEDADDAILTFTIEQSSFFQLDMVSLVPGKTWKNRPNGFRLDLMEKLAELHPDFILYQGDTTTTGFRAYGQLCEDLGAEAVYKVADSVTWQERRIANDRLQAAVDEACFLIRAENNPSLFTRLVYAPVAGNAYDKAPYAPLIAFNKQTSIASPTYFLLQMFARHRGDVMLKTAVSTYARPQVVFEDSLYAAFPASVDPPAGETEKSRIYLREDICLSVGTDSSMLYQLIDGKQDTLSVAPSPFAEGKEQPAQLQFVCTNDTIRCYSGNTLLHEATLPPLPSLVANASWDKKQQTLILKVVNTTHHNELTEINILGADIDKQARVLQLKGAAGRRNTFDTPQQVSPDEQIIQLPSTTRIRYPFPPHSITILLLTLNI